MEMNNSDKMNWHEETQWKKKKNIVENKRR